MAVLAWLMSGKGIQDMRGREELVALAGLLRLGASTARDIGTMRPEDKARIAALALRAEQIADELERISEEPPNSSAIHSTTMLQAEATAQQQKAAIGAPPCRA